MSCFLGHGPPCAGPPGVGEVCSRFSWGAHTTTREPQPPNFHKTTPKRRRMNENCGGRGRKKREILGPPPSGLPPFGALFLGLGPNPSGPQPALRGPPAGPSRPFGPQARHRRMLCSTSANSTSDNSTSASPAAPPDHAAGARTRQPENSKRAHFRAPALQTTKGPQEKEKKNAKFWALHPSGLHPSGPPPFCAPPFGPPLCRPKIQHPKIGRG